MRGYLARLKAKIQEKPIPEELSKLPKPPFDSFGSDRGDYRRRWAVALVGALVEAIGDAGVRKRFLGLCKAANEIHVKIGNPPSAAIGLVTAALQREPAQ